MTDEQENHDTSSGDTVVSRISSEKGPVEARSPAQETEHEMTDRREDGENAEENGGPVETQQSGAPLDRTPSQAQRMGKKKIIVVMAALCVGFSVCRLE